MDHSDRSAKDVENQFNPPPFRPRVAHSAVIAALVGSITFATASAVQAVFRSPQHVPGDPQSLGYTPKGDLEAAEKMRNRWTEEARGRYEKDKDGEKYISALLAIAAFLITWPLKVKKNIDDYDWEREAAFVKHMHDHGFEREYFEPDPTYGVYEGNYGPWQKKKEE